MDKKEDIDIMQSGNGIALLIDNETDQEWEYSYTEMLSFIETIPIFDDKYTLIVEL